MKTLAINLAPTISFKKLIEPQSSKYSHKQEAYAKELRNILSGPCTEDKKGRTWIEYFDKSFDSDILFSPNKNRNKLSIYAVDKETGYNDIVATCSPANKPCVELFSDYVNFVKEEIKVKNSEFIANLALFTIGIAMLIGIAAKNNTSSNVVNKAKTEFQIKVLKPLETDTLQLASRLVSK